MYNDYNDSDTVYIIHDGYNNIPKGTRGIITLRGALRKGVRQYHVNFKSVGIVGLRMSGSELSYTQPVVTSPSIAYVHDLINDLTRNEMMELLNHMVLQASPRGRATIKAWRKGMGKDAMVS